MRPKDGDLVFSPVGRKIIALDAGGLPKYDLWVLETFEPPAKDIAHYGITVK